MALDLSNELRKYYVDYIRMHFSEFLGPYANLLEEPDGLDKLAELQRLGKLGPRP